jgi:excinuclease ABC subunit C
MFFDPEDLHNYPVEPGVYLMKNSAGSVIYVGKAKSIRSRLKQYFASEKDTRKTVPLLLKELASIETVIALGEKEALLLENILIKKHKPKFNILLKDDKNFISLSIAPNDEWPRLQFSRFATRPQDGALHFGPYTSAKAARQTFDLMSRLFPLRQCSDEELKRRTRPCILYDIKRCVAPCVHKVSKEEYRSYVDSAIAFLQGKKKEVLQKLTEEMKEASRNLEFERAGSLLRTIRQIEHVTASANLSYQAKGKDTDVLALYREADQVLIARLLFRQGNLMGSENFFFQHLLEEEEEVFSSFLLQQYWSEKALPKEILLPISLPNQKEVSSILQDLHKRAPTIRVAIKGEAKTLIALAQKNAKAAFEQKKSQAESQEILLFELQEALHLSRYPKRIECFDTSNLAGKQLVASVVVFVDGQEDPKKGRLYHIKEIDKPDDYAAIHQVLTRRLQRCKEEEDLPDLLLIDGGKGQLHIALSVLKELGIASVDVASLAKDESRHDKGLTLDKVYLPNLSAPIAFAFHSPLLFFLQKIRDRAHVKACSFHRKTRAKQTIYSALDSIEGIGPVKKKKLLLRFGSLQNIVAQSEETLQTVPGLTKKDIKNIKKIAF